MAHYTYRTNPSWLMNLDMADDMFKQSEAMFAKSDALFKKSDEMFGKSDQMFGMSDNLFAQADKLHQYQPKMHHHHGFGHIPPTTPETYAKMFAAMPQPVRGDGIPKLVLRQIILPPQIIF